MIVKSKEVACAVSISSHRIYVKGIDLDHQIQLEFILALTPHAHWDNVSRV